MEIPVEQINNKVCIEWRYFNNVFVKPGSKNSVSGLTIRLMALLATELSFYEYRKLPSRRKMSKILGANEASVHKCLVFLEDNEFFRRSVQPEFEGMVRCDEEEHKKYQIFYAERIKEHKDKQGFSDFFILNYYYNADSETHEDFKNSIIKQVSNQCADIFDRHGQHPNDYNAASAEFIIRKLFEELLEDKETLTSVIQRILKKNP